MKMKTTVALIALVLLTMAVFAGGQGEERGSDALELTFMTVEAVYIEDWETNDFTQYMEEKTGIHINWETVPEQAAEEKLNLVLASGDYPDVFFGLGFTDDKLSLYGAEEGLLMPLNDLIREHMPNLTALMDEIPGSWGAITSPDGKIYGLPSFNICYHCQNANKAWVYKPWLDELGLEMPQTTEEFRRMLIAFRDRDPNGNGVRDEVPFAGAIKSWHATPDLFLLNAFVYTDIDSRIDISADRFNGFYLDNGTVRTMAGLPAYRDGLRYLNELYREGLIFPGSFTQDGPQLVQLVEGGELPVVGVALGGWAGIFSSPGSDRSRNYRPIEPLEGPDGTRSTPTYLSEPMPGRFVLSSDCRYPVEALQWVDYLYSIEGTLRARNGIEGQGWRWAEDGEIGVDGNAAIYKLLRPFNDTDPQNEHYMEVGPRALTSQFRFGEAVAQDIDLWAPEGMEKMLYISTRDLYRPHADSSMALPRLKFLPDEVSAYAGMRVEYVTYVKQSLVQFIVGDLDVESDWDAYVANLERLGQQELLEATQVAYDRQFR